MSLSTFHQPAGHHPQELLKGVGGLSLLCFSITAHKDTEARETNGPQLVGDGAMSPRSVSKVISSHMLIFCCLILFDVESLVPWVAIDLNI